VVSGKPVALVNTAAEGVPRAGDVKEGEVVKAILPDPLTFCPRAVATPVPKAVIPVPPFATGRVPVTPLVNGKPVALVRTAADGVPKAGVVSEGEVANTNAPLPVSSVTAAARFALDGVARKVATPVPKPEIPVDTGSPVALVSTTADGVPKSGVVNIGLVSVLLVRVSVEDIVGTSTLSNCSRLEAATANARFAPLAAFLQLTASVLDNRNTPAVAALAVLDVK
jgi:hypothetical protein